MTQAVGGGEPRLCPEGHAVPQTAAYCGMCGRAVRDPRAPSGRQALRRIGAFVLTLAALGVWFGLAPDELDHHVDTSAIEARDDLANARAGVPERQAVATGQTTHEYLRLLSKQLDEATQASVRDSRPAAMLGLVVLGLALLLFTAGPEREREP